MNTGLTFIPEIKSYEMIEKIIEGCSGDEKYKLQKDGTYFLLRVGDKSKALEKKKEYDRLKVYEDQGIHTHRPIAFGTTIDKFYSIVSWVDGVPIMEVIKKDVSKSYYQLGKKVGMELKKLHSSGTNVSKTDWRTAIEKKAHFFFGILSSDACGICVQ